MLTDEEIEKFKDHLEKAQNPIFFFDNDQDGLCSFLLLQRFIGRGKGVAIKSFPALDESYYRKVEELNSDYVFILDKPIVSKEFFDKVNERNIPIVYLDHHDIDFEIPDFVNYFNPCKTRNSCVPVTRLCYQITNSKKDMWIAVVGSISDGYLPSFYPDFIQEYPDMGSDTKDPFKVLYESKIGEVAIILSHGLKDTTTNVVKMLKFLIKVNSPYEILEENSKTYLFHKRAKYIQNKYERILLKAKNIANFAGNLVFFRYSGDLSVSGELANHLKYLYPGKNICVCYIKGSKINLSLRGKDIKSTFLKVIEGLVGANGGGHKDAVGGQMQADDLDNFKKKLEKELG